MTVGLQPGPQDNHLITSWRTRLLSKVEANPPPWLVVWTKHLVNRLNFHKPKIQSLGCTQVLEHYSLLESINHRQPAQNQITDQVDGDSFLWEDAVEWCQGSWRRFKGFVITPGWKLRLSSQPPFHPPVTGTPCHWVLRSIALHLVWNDKENMEIKGNRGR